MNDIDNVKTRILRTRRSIQRERKSLANLQAARFKNKAEIMAHLERARGYLEEANLACLKADRIANDQHSQ